MASTGFIAETIKNYSNFATEQHKWRDKYMEGAKGGDTTQTLQLLDNQQEESRHTGLVVNVIGKQDEMLRKAVDAMRG
ncbi:hypothetical protein MW7_014005 [Imbroritus primus]|uniref:Uncharacterized protein n=1 Tax=Imbroritus primus TaxID=3058603 RepID=A0ACD3SLG0_9BURK|nr:hypothetical protein MW7_014005 [Burkholderiaceae bacterium PBA]